ncbi:LPS export ABC transporter periplasmic protein LptC [Gammaproteobacteria bacterium]|nr:LPS export ABC transporter periplasmic protein LptC [Gammaproteobacteria bacterium]
MFNTNNLGILLLLIMAASLSSWSIFFAKKPDIIALKKPTQPDSFMENVITTIINKEGDKSVLIKSPRIIHYSKNDTTIIESPKITIYRDSPKPWIINSDYAKATSGINKIFFWSNVVIHHPVDVKTPLTTFTTKSLTVYTKNNIAKTSDAVTLTQPESTVNGIGMTANLNNGEIQLLSKARGEYVPKQ